jgi:PQQ-like domain
MSTTTPNGPATTSIPLPFVPVELAWSEDGHCITADGLAAVDVGTKALMWQASGGGTFAFAQVATAGSNLVGMRAVSNQQVLQMASQSAGAELWRRNDLFGLMSVDDGGRRIAVAAGDGCHIVDLMTGADIVLIARTPLWPVWPAFSPAGRQLAIASAGSLVIADTATGTVVHQLAMSPDPVAVEFDESGSTLMCVDRAARVTIVNASSGLQISQSALEGLDSIPPNGSLLDLQRPVALSPDRRLVAVVTPEEIAIFVIATGRRLGAIPTDGQRDYITHLVFSPDARSVAVSHINAATGPASTTAKLIAAPVPRLLWERSSAVSSGPAFSRSGRMAVAQNMVNPGLPGVLNIVDTGAVVMQAEGAGPGQAVLGIDVTGTGIRLVAGICADQAARIYSVDGGRLLYEREHPGPLTDVVFLDSGQGFATACADGGVRLYDTVSGQRRWLAPHTGPVNALASAPAGDFVCTAGSDKTVRCLDASTGAQRWQAAFPQGVTRVLVSPDGAFAVAACSDRTARLLRVADGSQAWQVQHDARIRDLTVSPDATLVATASEDGSVLVVASGTGAISREVSHVQGATSVAFSADGQDVISGSLDGAVLVSRVADPAQPPGSLVHAAAPVLQIKSGPGRSVAVVTQDGLVRVIDLDLQAEIARINPNANVNDIAVDTRAGLLATGSDDGAIRVDTWGN